jgi:hypothetical protein
MKMNSTFRLKSSIALLALGLVMLAAPKQTVKSTVSPLSDYQSVIAASAVGAIANTIQHEII